MMFEGEEEWKEEIILKKENTDEGVKGFEERERESWKNQLYRVKEKNFRDEERKKMTERERERERDRFIWKCPH